MECVSIIMTIVWTLVFLTSIGSLAWVVDCCRYAVPFVGNDFTDIRILCS